MKTSYQEKTLVIYHNAAELHLSLYSPLQNTSSGNHSYLDIRRTPLLLLHGNAGSQHEFDKQIDYFATQRTVIALDSRGQGLSKAGLSPTLNYELMADDTLEVLDRLGVCQVHVLGYSDGAILGLLMALKASHRIRSLSCIGVNTQPEGINRKSSWFIALSRKFLKLKLKLKDKSPAEKEKTLFHIALFELMLHEPHISMEELNSILTPCLLINGEKDVIVPEHSAAIAQALPHAQYERIDGAQHFLLKSHAKLINPLIEKQLRDHDKQLKFRELSAHPELYVRKLTQEDKPLISELFSELYHQLHSEHDYSGWDKEVYPRLELIDIALTEGNFYGCFNYKNQLLGCMRLLYGMERNFDACGWEILQSSQVISPTTLICSPRARNKAVASTLIHFAFTHALKDPEVKALRLNTATQNAAAHYLYHSLGFTAYKPIYYPYKGLTISPWSCPFELRVRP